MATEVDRLIVTLEARLAGYEANMRRGQLITNQRLDQMERRFSSFSKNSSASIGGLGIAIGGIWAYLSGHEIKNYADQWTTVTRALDAGEQSFGVRLRSAQDLNKIATEARADLDAFSKLYLRTAAATRDLGTSEDDVARATATVSKALKLGSATASEQASVLLQLSQAFNKGKLDGDEFRSVMENAVIIQQLLADKLKVSKGEIIKMAAAGKLVVKDLIGALIDGADEVDRIFNSMPSTIGEVFTKLNNAIVQYIGINAEAKGGALAFSNAISGIANNIETVGDSALVAGAALAGMFAPRVIAGIAAGGVGLAAAAGPIGLIAGGVAAASTAFSFLADDIAVTGDGLVTVKDYIEAIIDVVGGKLQPVFDTAGAVISKAVDVIRAGLDGVGVSFEDIANAARTSVNAIVGVMTFAASVISNSFTSLPPAIANAFVTMANQVLSTVESMANGVIDILNHIPGVEIGRVSGLKIANGFEDATYSLSEIVKKAASNLGHDFVGEFSRGIDGLKAEIDKKAGEIAAGRGLAASTTTKRELPSRAGVTSTTAESGSKRSPFAREVRQIEEHIRALQLENSLLGANAVEADAARAAMELLNAAKQEGIAITPELLAKIDALSRKYAEAKAEAELLREAMEEFKSTSKDVLKGFITDLKEGKSGTEALSGALNKLADKLLDMAINQLVDKALGPLVGGLLSGGGGGGSGAAFSLFAKGGVAAYGKPLPTFAGGGVSKSAAIFGEAGPEAAVPLPDGRRIPVDLRLPSAPAAAAANSGPAQITVAPVFNVQNGTPEGIDKLKREIVPMMRQVAQGELAQQIDRHPVFAPLRRR